MTVCFLKASRRGSAHKIAGTVIYNQTTKVALLHLYWFLLVSNALGGRERIPRPPPKKSFVKAFCSQNGIKQKVNNDKVIIMINNRHLPVLVKA